MKLLTLNTAGRLLKIQDQIKELVSENCDLICLQEVIQNSKKIFYEELPKYGYKWIADSSFENISKHTGPRKYCLMTASRYRLKKLESLYKVGWSEKMLMTECKIGNKKIEIVNTYIPPGSSNGVRKLNTIKEIFENLKLSNYKYKILCGDWNSPQHEFAGGKIMSWGESIRKNGDTYISDKKYDDVERLFLERTNDLNLFDDFRRVNGYDKEEYSYYIYRKGLICAKRRFDHIYSTKNLNLRSCNYRHSFRKKLLSDHSALVSEYKL